MTVDQDSFEEFVTSQRKYDYVGDEQLAFFAEMATFSVIDRSAMEKSDVEQTEFVSIAFAEDASNFTDEELIEKIKTAMTDGSRDIQKYQLRDEGEAPNTVEVWRHGSGVSAFAFAE